MNDKNILKNNIKNSRLLNLAIITLIDIDLEHIQKHLKDWDIKYDKEEKEWKINGDYIEDFFWYGDSFLTYLHPKELKHYIVKLIEKEINPYTNIKYDL